ncbi:MAG: thiopurine S-methyltransferase [Gammaproteobacteria bacterium]
MLWLREQGFEVLGVEMIALAVESFFTENAIPMQKRQTGAFTVCRGEGLTLLCGDFFDLTAVEAADCAAVYDRASLIALPPALRTRYTAHLLGLFPDGLNALLVTLEYPQGEMDGPPFSVSESEVQALYGDHCTIERLLDRDALNDHPNFRANGLTRLEEKVYLLSPIRTG